MPVTVVSLKVRARPPWSPLMTSRCMGSIDLIPSSGMPAAMMGSAACADDTMQALSPPLQGFMKGAAGKHSLSLMKQRRLALN